MGFKNADATFHRNVGYNSPNDTASRRRRLKFPCIIFTKHVAECKYSKFDYRGKVALHLSGFIGMAGYPDMQKILITIYFVENRLHWQCEVRLLLFTVCTCV